MIEINTERLEIFKNWRSKNNSSYDCFSVTITTEGIFLDDVIRIESNHDSYCCEWVWVEWDEATGQKYYPSIYKIAIEPVRNYGLKITLYQKENIAPIIIDVPAYGADNYYSSEFFLEFYEGKTLHFVWSFDDVAQD